MEKSNQQTKLDSAYTHYLGTRSPLHYRNVIVEENIKENIGK